MKKQIVYLQNKLQLSNKKGWTIDTYKSMGKFQNNFAEWKQPEFMLYSYSTGNSRKYELIYRGKESISQLESKGWDGKGPKGTITKGQKKTFGDAG